MYLFTSLLQKESIYVSRGIAYYMLEPSVWCVISEYLLDKYPYS